MEVAVRRGGRRVIDEEALAKYRAAAAIANEALHHLVANCFAGVDAHQLCLDADTFSELGSCSEPHSQRHTHM